MVASDEEEAVLDTSKYEARRRAAPLPSSERMIAMLSLFSEMKSRIWQDNLSN